MAIDGNVSNDAEGVLIRCTGPPGAIQALLDQLRAMPPVNARIDSIRVEETSEPMHGGFSIIESAVDNATVSFAPDLATCLACLDEIRDPAQRRYRYPFTNCTACGPRLTIVERAPYDRANTTMRDFPMCAACAAEYASPRDRRFHAEPIACPVCGPQLHLLRPDGTPFDGAGGDVIAAAADLLLQGNILAIKGLGGFHLACDATQSPVIAELRRRKRRPAKPLAVMMRDLVMVQRFCAISDAEAAFLRLTEAPILLLRRQDHALPDVLAPGLDTLGVMLPYTPAHHVLLEHAGRPLVMTSANIADAPQCVDWQCAGPQLVAVVDAVLDHDRRIAHRVDDSVVRMIGGSRVVLRRARGFAPASIKLPAKFDSVPDILALGSELKNTMCLLRHGVAHLSQHIGDLEHEPAFDDYLKTIELQQSLHNSTPGGIAVDCHPEFLSTKLGYRLAAERNIQLIETQHHHAHVASCLVDNYYPADAPPVLGIVLDGLGFGDDGTLWGGEFLLAGYGGYQRLGCLKPVAMPGGAQAVREPWRNTYAHIAASLGWTGFERLCRNTALHRCLVDKPLRQLDAMMDRGLNSPLASSCGRLFDAVAVALGLVQTGVAYEGQGGAELEALAQRQLGAVIDEQSGYSFGIDQPPGSPFAQLNPGPMWHRLLLDVAANEQPALMAARFHLGLAQAVLQMTQILRVSSESDRPVFDTVALSGGCFQNKVLAELVADGLNNSGVRVLTHCRVPANDGGLALGQAAIAAWRLIQERST